MEGSGTAPLPMHIQQAAMAHQLGAFTRRYTSVAGRAIAALVGGLIFVFVGIYTSATSQGEMGMLPGLVIVLVALGIAVFALYRAMRLIGRRVYLFQQGLILRERGGIQVFPWSQVAEVSQKITPRGSRKEQRFTPIYRYTLRRVDGYQIVLDSSTKKIESLGPIIVRATAPDPVAQALHSIRGGQALTFGRFSVNRQGFGDGREFIPWLEVQSVTEYHGQVTINRGGRVLNWDAAMAGASSQISVFLAVAQEMIRQEHVR